MRNRTVAIASLMTLVGLSMTAGLVDASGWKLLGTRKADFRADHDVITVTGVEGTFSGIKLDVRGNGLELRDLKVVFGDGRVQDVRVRRHLAPGQSTRVIELTGGARVIRKVTFWYRSHKRPRGRATVRLLGREAVEPHVDAPARAPADVDEGWRSIGTRSVGLRGDHDVIPVTATEGSFDRMRLRVAKNGVEIRRLVVRFGNGGKQEIALRKYIAPGKSTRAIELSGGERVINRIELWYRARPPRSGQARIVVLAE